MVMVLLVKHLHGLEVSCLQDPGGLGETDATSQQDRGITVIRSLE